MNPAEEEMVRLRAQVEDLQSENESLKRQIDKGWANAAVKARTSVVSGIFRRFGIEPRHATPSSKTAAALLKQRITRALASRVDTVDQLIRTDKGYDLGYAAALLVSIGRDFGIELADPRGGAMSPEARRTLEDAVREDPMGLSELEIEDGDDELLNEAATALIFCSGSYDFGPEGQAKEGWDRLCRPVLTKLLVRTPSF